MIHVNQQEHVQIHQESSSLSLQWPDGFTSTFQYIWLRDNCKKLRDPHSGQRVVNPKDIPSVVSPQSVKLNVHSQLEIVWEHDQHISQYDLGWLRAHSYSNGEEYIRKARILWDSSLEIGGCEMDFESVMNDEEALRDWLTIYQEYGFARLINVPANPKIVLEIGNQISHIWNRKELTDGSYFEIIGKPDKAYLAFSTKALPTHTDEPYHWPSDPILMLHCMANEVEGGDSTLVDGFNVAKALKERFPTYFDLLTKIPVKFMWQSEEHHYEVTTPIIRLDFRDEIEHVFYSNHSIQPFRCPLDIMETFYEAYRTYSNMLMGEEFQIDFRFKAGDLNLVDNTRILHGRTAFSKQGLRHLQGCYLAQDSLYSKLAVLNKKLAK